MDKDGNGDEDGDEDGNGNGGDGEDEDGGLGMPCAGRSDATAASPPEFFFGGSVAVIHCDVTSSGGRWATSPGNFAGDSTIGLPAVRVTLVGFDSLSDAAGLLVVGDFSVSSAAATVSSAGRVSFLTSNDAEDNQQDRDDRYSDLGFLAHPKASLP